MSRPPVRVLAPLLAAAALLAPVASGADGWTTLLRAEQYTALLARHDTVWCASLEGGLGRYVASADRFESFQRRPGGISSQALTALCFDRSGRLYVGSQDHGISRLGADGVRWDVVSQLDGLPAGAVRALRAVGDTILIGTDHGVALWNGTEMAGTVPEGVNPSPFASDAVNGVVLRGDSLWVATDKGLWVSPPSTGLQHWALVPDFGQDPVLRLGWDGTALMALVGGTASRGGSVFQFQPGSGAWVPTSSLGLVQELYDGGGTILAVSDRGVFRWAGAGWSGYAGAPISTACVIASPSGFACSGTAAAVLDGTGRLWVANRDGLRDLDQGAWTLHVPDAPPGNNVQNLLVQDDRLYVATYQEGFGRLEAGRWRNWLPPAWVGGDTTFLQPLYLFALLADSQGHKWVGSWSRAMEEFDDSGAVPAFTHHVVADSLGADRHTFGWSSACDAAGGRWFGMDTNSEESPPIGIDYYDPAGNYVANYRSENTPTMPGDQIRALCIDPRRGSHGNLWVGFAGKGVRVFALPATPGDSLEAVNGGYPNDLKGLDIFGLVAHGDSIWVLSTANLQCYGAGTFTPLSGTSVLRIAGGMPSRGACHPMDVGPDGSVWVGSDLYGVRVFRPGVKDPVDYNTSNSPIAGDEVRAIRVDPATGVVWIGTATGLSRFDPGYVAPPAPQPPSLEVRAYPNPAWQTGAGPALRLSGNATGFHGAVYDATGRLLRRFDTAAGQVFWDGRDSSGQLVRPGVYFVRVRAGDRARTLRIALLR